MKTLVMFEAFGHRLKSEPEIWNNPGREIRLPLQIRPPSLKDFSVDKMSSLSHKAATFELFEERRLPDWEFPIKIYRLVDV